MSEGIPELIGQPRSPGMANSPLNICKREFRNGLHTCTCAPTNRRMLHTGDGTCTLRCSTDAVGLPPSAAPKVQKPSDLAWGLGTRLGESQPSTPEMDLPSFRIGIRTLFSAVFASHAADPRYTLANIYYPHSLVLNTTY